MKCVSISGKKSLVLKDKDIPISKDGSVVIEVKSAGICGSDIHNWDMGAPVGLVMGHEFAGIVVDPGSRKDLVKGDRVTGLPISPCGKCEACHSGNVQYCADTWSEAVGLALTNPGGFAEYTSCRPDMVRKIPGNVSYDAACMVEPSAVSLHAINLANIKIGDSVLIVGGGIIGLMAAEFARLAGAGYIAIVETNKKRGRKAVNYGKINEYYDALKEDTIPKLMMKTNGGFDKVIECCGNASAVSEALMTVKPGGTIVLVGVSAEPITVPLVVGVMKEVTIQGAIAYTPAEFDECIKLIAEKKINVTKYIDDLVPLEAAQESFERLTSGKDAAVKIIFKP
ncbi:MAG: alcohol dehydrogenase catalytic domain-containing protein [Bacilli bacterium]|nr:alcohol dehydrogenase catalytic domain-containing protein [Bacilli bacterium]